MPITDWPAAERPREKLLQHGPPALTDAELLALFLRIGVPGKTAVDLARELLTTFGGLNGLFAATRADFTRLHGMGDAKYAQLQAVLEMARRALVESMQKGVSPSSPKAVKDYLILSLSALPHEVFQVLFLNMRHELVASEELFRGTLSQTSVYPREVVKRALALNAAAVIHDDLADAFHDLLVELPRDIGVQDQHEFVGGDAGLLGGSCRVAGSSVRTAHRPSASGRV